VTPRALPLGRPIDVTRAVLAGAIGTGVLTALWLVEPSVGLPSIAVGQILSSAMSVSVAWLHVGVAGGWLIHLVAGVLLALLYASELDHRLPGPPAVRGALYGTLVFVVAQLVFMPLVGAGVFSRGDVALLAGSLLGHLAYGVVTGWIYALAARGSSSLRSLESTETG
jgi:hypothetical protein